MQVTSTAEMTFPSDANIAGNVHGGEIMKRIDKAGWLAASRHARRLGNPPPLVTACLASMDFVRPAHVGDILNLTAWVVFTSRRSVEVKVEVRAENWEKGLLHGGAVTNVANMVYVVPPSVETDIPQLPPVVFPLGGEAPSHEKAADDSLDEESFMNEAGPAPMATGTSTSSMVSEAQWKLDRAYRRMWLEGRRRYLSGKASRRLAESKTELSPRRVTPSVELAFPSEFHIRLGAGEEEEAAKISTLTHVCLTGDSFQPHKSIPAGVPVFGGVMLKLIDNCCGIAAFRHARTNVVTASIEDTNLVSPVVVGDLVTARARVVFTSSRSIEVACALVAESAREGKCRIVARATTVFISLSPVGKVLPVTQIEVPEEGTRERALYDEAKARYEQRRAQRAAAAAAAVAAKKQ